MSRRGFIRNSAAMAAVTAAAPSAHGAGSGDGVFRACVAVRDITPPPGLPMWGYSDRPGAATGTLDPLFAKAVVFGADDKQAAVVALDLGRVPTLGVCERIRVRVARAGVREVFFVASHTHHGPLMEIESMPHIPAIEKSICECIEEAAAGLAPAQIGVGRTTIDVAHNRRIITEDGRCLMLWRNESRKPTGPLDREAGVIRLDRADGTPLAVLVNLACHPVVLGQDNVEYSADYPGEMARLVKEATGAECIFLQGACGDINPYLDKTPIAQGGVKSMRSVGQTCAKAVLDVFGSIKTAAPDRPSLAHARIPVQVGLRWNIDDPEQEQILRGAYGPMFDAYVGAAGHDLAVPLGVLVLHDDLALTFMPGEFFVQFQIDLKNGSPLQNTFFCGYADEFHAYFPTVRGAAAGGYGGVTATYVGLGAGEKMVTRAQIEIGRLTNLLRPKCTPADFDLIEVEADEV